MDDETTELLERAADTLETACWAALEAGLLGQDEAEDGVEDAKLLRGLAASLRELVAEYQLADDIDVVMALKARWARALGLPDETMAVVALERATRFMLAEEGHEREVGPSIEALRELVAEYQLADDEWAAVRLATVAGLPVPERAADDTAPPHLAHDPETCAKCDVEYDEDGKLVPPSATPQGGRFAGMRWYANLPDEGFVECDTAEEARRVAEDACDGNQWDGEWPDGMECVEWGLLVPFAEVEEFDRKPVPEGSEHDYLVSYRLKSSDALARLASATTAPQGPEPTCGECRGRGFRSWSDEDGVPHRAPCSMCDGSAPTLSYSELLAHARAADIAAMVVSPGEVRAAAAPHGGEAGKRRRRLTLAEWRAALVAACDKAENDEDGPFPPRTVPEWAGLMAELAPSDDCWDGHEPPEED